MTVPEPIIVAIAGGVMVALIIIGMSIAWGLTEILEGYAREKYGR